MQSAAFRTLTNQHPHNAITRLAPDTRVLRAAWDLCWGWDRTRARPFWYGSSASMQSEVQS